MMEFKRYSTNLPSRVASLGIGMGHPQAVYVNSGNRIQASLRLLLMSIASEKELNGIRCLERQTQMANELESGSKTQTVVVNYTLKCKKTYELWRI